MQEKIRKALYEDAKAIGLIVLSFGDKESHQSGFFAHGVTALEVVKRIREQHDPLRMTQLAALDYLKGHRALLENTDVKAFAYNPEAKKRFRNIEAALSARLCDALLSSYARLARAETEAQRRKLTCMRSRNKAKRARRAAKLARLKSPDAEQVTA